jgi:hypothetical protein
MGIWSAYIYTYNSGASIDTSKLSNDSIDWINNKIKYGRFPPAYDYDLSTGTYNSENEYSSENECGNEEDINDENEFNKKLDKLRNQYVNASKDVNIIKSISKESGFVNFKKILSHFCDTSSIYGYINDKMENILDNIASCLTELTTIVFTCDGNVNVRYYGLRMDPSTKKHTLLLVDNYEDIKDDLENSIEECINTNKFIRKYIKKDKIIWVPIEESKFKKNRDKFIIEKLKTNPELKCNKAMLELALIFAGF